MLPVNVKNTHMNYKEYLIYVKNTSYDINIIINNLTNSFIVSKLEIYLTRENAFLRDMELNISAF